ncbi:HAD domain-containing protein [Tenacibaculum sp. 190524A02b]|uniref:HAD domain-containing protein n=1 Tax=Tenacibaculum vairaonense TaxID=3137860 RepID=UPI0031FAF6DA
MKPKTILILGLDGVLITTPPWKADVIHTDGYSQFNINCVTNLNKLLTLKTFDIWLSSTRRTTKTLTEFNQIFINRGIIQPIKGFLPVYKNCTSRKDEIISFINDFNLNDLLIIDDDKSLNAIPYKNQLVLTQFLKGFNNEALSEAIKKSRL